MTIDAVDLFTVTVVKKNVVGHMSMNYSGTIFVQMRYSYIFWKIDEFRVLSEVSSKSMEVPYEYIVTNQLKQTKKLISIFASYQSS